MLFITWLYSQNYHLVGRSCFSLQELGYFSLVSSHISSTLWQAQRLTWRRSTGKGTARRWEARSSAPSTSCFRRSAESFHWCSFRSTATDRKLQPSSLWAWTSNQAGFSDRWQCTWRRGCQAGFRVLWNCSDGKCRTSNRQTSRKEESGSPGRDGTEENCW